MTSSARNGLLWPTVFAAAALAVLLGLGTWQWQRLIWKQGLIDQIAARTTAPPIPLTEALRRHAAGEDMEYARVIVEGRWRHDRERLLWSPHNSGPGWHVYTPLETGAGKVVIVNRGFIADTDRDRSKRPEPAADGAQVRVVGLMRRPESKTTFTPDNDLAANKWFWRDLAGMARSMLGDRAADAAPFFLDAEPSPQPPASAGTRAPRGGGTLLAIPNSHFQYALTWYGLALTLIGVYVAYALQRLRAPSGPPARPDEKSPTDAGSGRG